MRADHFQPIEDLKRAQEEPAFGSEFRVSNYVRTWRIMTKIVLRLEGDADWSAPRRARSYQADQLGRFGGATFLADLYPLPAENDADWPYPELYPTRDDYRREVLPHRLGILHTLWQQYSPLYVFCYGKGHWAEYQQLFSEIEEYAPILEGAMRLGYARHGRLVVPTPFQLREERFTTHDDEWLISDA